MFGSLVARLTTCPTFEYGIFHNDPDALQGHCVIMKSYYFRLRHFPKDDLFSGRNVLRSPVTIRPCKKWPRDEISQRSNVPSTFVTFVQTSKRSNVLGIARQTSSATIKLESKLEAITNLLKKLTWNLNRKCPTVVDLGVRVAAVHLDIVHLPVSKCLNKQAATSVHCTVYTVHCTLYRIRYIFKQNKTNK